MNRSQSITGILYRAALAATVSLGLVHPVRSEPLKLEFMPPDLDVGQVCVPRRPDGEMMGVWQSWDGKTLPYDDPDLVKRDLSRLEHVDPVKWHDTIAQAIKLLPTIDQKYSRTHALVDQIDLMVAANKTNELKSQRLVHQLVADAETLSPRFQSVLATYLIDGTGIEADPKRGFELLKSAAYAGNADALLQLAKRDLDGMPVDGWDIDPYLAVTMALGALVGELNPTICDRIWRIAREFHNGELVEKDATTAEAWFRFAADLGDVNAAWEVAQYHLESEEFEKDNDILVTYLTRAADGGLPYAKIELGRLHEGGALVPRDLKKSLELYRDAARYDNRSGQLRLARFLDDNAAILPGTEEELKELMKVLVDMPDAPGWVFARVAEDLLLTKGRWAAETEARALLEKAVALDDKDAVEELALLLMRNRREAGSFNRGLDLMAQAVTYHGSINGMDKLRGANMCIDPDGPRLDQAAYWQSLDNASDTATLEFTAEQLLEEPWRDDPAIVARMQSQALYGRPEALANYITMLETSPDVSDEMRAFWDDYAEGDGEVMKARARIAFELAATDQDRRSALNLMRLAVNQGDPRAAIELAELLLEFETLSDDARAEAAILLEPIAEQGNGDALNILLLLEGRGPERKRALYDRFAEVIQARGDFEALLFALPHVEGEVRLDYLDRAVSVMICDFKSTMRIAEVLSDVGNTDEAQRWLDISSQLTEGFPWALVKLGDGYRTIVGRTATDQSIAAYEAAFDVGSYVGGLRLFAILGVPESDQFDEARGMDILTRLVRDTRPENLPAVLARLRTASPRIQRAVSEQVDVKGQYLAAAETGDGGAMVQYARLLREDATTPAEVQDAIGWMTRAAEADNAAAMVELANAYAFGLGVEPSRKTAILWLERAAALDNKTAGSYLDVLAMPQELVQ